MQVHTKTLLLICQFFCICGAINGVTKHNYSDSFLFSLIGFSVSGYSYYESWNDEEKNSDLLTLEDKFKELQLKNLENTSAIMQKFLENAALSIITKQQNTLKTIQQVGNESEAIAALPQVSSLQECEWYHAAVNYLTVLVYGGQGGGKTTLATNLAYDKQKAGYKLIVLDVHAAKGTWKGLEVIGWGQDYAAVDAKMQWFFDECKRRYELITQYDENIPEEKTILDEKMPKICFIVEEMTNFAEHCVNAKSFFNRCLSDIRKVYMHTIFISHNDTLASLGGSAGMAKTKDMALMKINLLAPTKTSPRRCFVVDQGSKPVEQPIPEITRINDFRTEEQIKEDEKIKVAQTREPEMLNDSKKERKMASDLIK